MTVEGSKMIGTGKEDTTFDASSSDGSPAAEMEAGTDTEDAHTEGGASAGNFSVFERMNLPRNFVDWFSHEDDLDEAVSVQNEEPVGFLQRMKERSTGRRRRRISRQLVLLIVLILICFILGIALIAKKAKNNKSQSEAKDVSVEAGEPIIPVFFVDEPTASPTGIPSVKEEETDEVTTDSPTTSAPTVVPSVKVQPETNGEGPTGSEQSPATSDETPSAPKPPSNPPGVANPTSTNPPGFKPIFASPEAHVGPITLNPVATTISPVAEEVEATIEPTATPSEYPSDEPTGQPTTLPPTDTPTGSPSAEPVSAPTKSPVLPEVRTLSPTVTVVSSAAATVGTFYAIGDVPYNPMQARQLEQQMLQVPEDAEFLIHVGDLRGSDNTTLLCKLEEYEATAAILRKSPVPVFIVVGDNEWNDCTNPDEGLGFWRQTFQRFDRKHWVHNFQVKQQPGRPENFSFVHKGTLYIGLNIVGLPVLSVDEWNMRLSSQLMWTQQLIREYEVTLTRSKTQGRIVLIAHANPSRAHNRFFEPLHAFVSEKLRNSIPIMYVNGDKHEWSYDPLFMGQSSMLRIMLTGGSKEPPLKVVVDSSTRISRIQEAFVHDRGFKSWGQE